jgi:CRP-like cAMP-binding protein
MNSRPMKIDLRALDRETIARFALVPIKFEVEHEIESPGDAINHLYFVEEGMASITTTFSKWSSGGGWHVSLRVHHRRISSYGTKQSLNWVYLHIAGSGYSCSLGAGRREFKWDGVFQLLALRYVQTQLPQAMQSAGCNAQHEVDQRLARWLLICSDRARTTTLQILHDYLVQMLGNSRPTVFQAAAFLKARI